VLDLNFERRTCWHWSIEVNFHKLISMSSTDKNYARYLKKKLKQQALKDLNDGSQTKLCCGTVDSGHGAKPFLTYSGGGGNNMPSVHSGGPTYFITASRSSNARDLLFLLMHKLKKLLHKMGPLV
jgi:hypothetical protein